MKNKILRSIIITCIAIIMCLIIGTTSDAASISISPSKSTVEPGEVFMATITLNGGAGPVSASVQNGSGSGTQFLDNGSMSISCTAGSSGTVTISASGTVGDYVTETDVYVSNSASVTIVQPAAPEPEPTQTSPTVPAKTTTPTKPAQTSTKSSNATLASLEVAEGAISPEYTWREKSYTLSVPYEVTKISIAATAESSRATVDIEENEELEVGENEIRIIVTAEDGTKNTYKLTVTRELPVLNLQELSIYYLDENGEKVKLLLAPSFKDSVYEYSLANELSYKIKELVVDAIATREDAIIEISGDKEIQEGDNEIIIKLTLPKESVEEDDEIEETEETENLEEVVNEETKQVEERIYKISFTKEAEPEVVPETAIGQFGKWFTGFGSKIGKWITDNYDRIISGLVLIATALVVGLTVYFIADYKNYKKLLAKLAEYNKANLMEKANVALNPDKVEFSENQEEIEVTESTNNEPQEMSNLTEDNLDEEEKTANRLRTSRRERRGRRFRE